MPSTIISPSNTLPFRINCCFPGTAEGFDQEPPGITACRKKSLGFGPGVKSMSCGPSITIRAISVPLTVYMPRASFFGTLISLIINVPLNPFVKSPRHSPIRNWYRSSRVPPAAAGADRTSPGEPDAVTLGVELVVAQAATNRTKRLASNKNPFFSIPFSSFLVVKRFNRPI